MSTTYAIVGAEARTFTAPDTGSVVLTYSADLRANRDAYAIISPEVRVASGGPVILAASDDHGLAAFGVDLDEATRQLLVQRLTPGVEYVANLLGRTSLPSATGGHATIGNARIDVTPVSDWREDIAQLVAGLESAG